MSMGRRAGASGEGGRLDSPRSGTVWKEMTGTRARWMTCTYGVMCALRMSEASWNRERFRVSSSKVDAVVITRSVSLRTDNNRGRLRDRVSAKRYPARE